MAQQLDYTLPFNDLTQYVPQALRNQVITGLIDNLFNRFMTHDESIPLYGYVGRKPVAPEDRTGRVPQMNAERDLNAVIPVLHFDQGTQKYAFTVQDLVAKAKVLGVDQAGMNWLYTQANNYLPPIDIDKFANFYNYFWTAKSLPTTPSLAWNTENLPEYYVIARSSASDVQKMNVVCATTENIVRTGTGFNDQTFTIQFITPLQFTVTANAPLGVFVASGLGATTANSFTFNLAAGVPPVNGETFAFAVTGPGAVTKTLMSFKIQRDPVYDSDGVLTQYEGYVAGDTLLIDTIFLSRTYTVSPVSLTAGIKGKIKNVEALYEYQTIDGITVQEGQRVLVKNNSNIENGIYIVGPQAWTRAPDYDGANIVAGVFVWIAQGVLNSGRLYESGPGNSWPDPLHPALIAESNTNDWQEGNYWVHASELTALGLTRSQVVQAVRPIIEYQSDLQLNGYITNGVPSETGFVFFKQKKTEFNQLPLFDLFRYDGTHSGLVSSIFYYVEDLTGALDLDLQKRVKTSGTDSSDYVFNHGMVDANGDLLFYKKSGALKTIWHAGYDSAVAVDQSFVGKHKGEITELIPTTISVPQTWTLTALTTPAATTSTTFSVVGSITGPLPDLNVGLEYIDEQFSITVTLGTIPFYPGEQFVFTIGAGPTVSPITYVGPVKGTLTNIVPNTHTQQQVWTLQAISSTQFLVSGSKTATLPTTVDTLTVGTPYSNGEFSCLITAGSQPYDIDDTFLFRIGNFEVPRYVYRDSADQIYDLYGGEAGDTTGIGAYTISRPFTYNPYNAARDEVLEGTLYGHFRSIIQNQIPETTENFAFGGTIKNWSEQQTLLASLLMQRDLTPISMIDLAQSQYEVGLNSLADTFKQTIAQYFTSVGVVDIDGTVEQDTRLDALLDSLLAKRAEDLDVRTVLYDSTSGVVGIPTTLPQLGILPLTAPSIGFDGLLNGDFLRHHDGHASNLYQDNVDFRRSILNNSVDIEVLRSDGTKTAAVGSFTTAMPVRPYRGELWIYPSGADSLMYAFDIDFDLQTAADAAYPTPSTPPIGTTVFRRDEGVGGQLYAWDGAHWVLQPSFAQQWRLVDIADTLNQLLLRVEERLYAHINVNNRRVDFTPLYADPKFNTQLERELYSYAVKYGLDPYASDYVPTDAFTWNYSQASLTNFPPLNTATVPARWFNVLKAHQGTVAGVIPTERPNIEPFKLLGYNDLTTWWATLTLAQQQAFTPYAYPNDLQSGAFTNLGFVRAVKTVAGVTSLSGLQVVDGVSLNAGDLVLLLNESASANNGIWVVSSGAWSRASLPMTQRVYVTAAEGVYRGRTIWTLTQTVNTLNVDPVLFKQVRLWTDELWFYVAAQRPTLRLSVDITNDALLPPYVSGTVGESAWAFTTVVPGGVSLGYAYGEGSLVETLWIRSLDFGYCLARALFRHDPLYFLGFCWGFNWVSVDGVLYDGYDLNTPGHKRFKLHGEPVRSIARDTSAFSITGATGAAAVDVTLTYDAYESDLGNRYQNFSVRESSGKIIGHVREGVLTVLISNYGIQLTNIRIEDRGQPFHIGDSFRVTANADGSNLTWSFTPISTHQILGFGQIFTNALRNLSVDTTDSYAIDAFRNWDVNMGYRAGGLVSTDDLKVWTDSDTLTSASYSLMIKKNEIAKDLWVQGLRITVSNFGSTVDLNNAYAPKTDASDWTFRIEGYNPRYTGITYYALDTAGPYQTFNVLDQTVTTSIWKNYSNITGTVSTNLPFTITGLQNVVNFIFGYSKYLEAQGWAFNQDPATNNDFETTRSRTWQLEAEKLIAIVYNGILPDQGHVLNSFMDSVWVSQPQGLLSEFVDNAMFDITANPGVFDMLGTKMPTSDLYLIRGNLQSMISAAAPMYSVHAQVDEYEHLFIMNYYVEDSLGAGVLYQPFSGSRVVTYKFNGRRQGTNTLRPEFGGHYIQGPNVRKNLQASTDAVAEFYDANKAFETETSTRHALSLLGFSTKEYFDALDISEKSQFNFWRGLIQSKGTNMSISAYLNNNRFEDAKIDEYWAYKVATFGDSRQNTYPELKLQVVDTIQQFTQLQFDSAVGGELPNFTQITRFDEDRWFTIDDLDHDTFFKAEVVGTFYLPSSTSGAVFTLPFVADKLVGTGFTQLNSTTIVSTGGVIAIDGYGPATPRYNPVKLFNYVADELVEEIPLWHPAMGKHTPTALESLNVISEQNPAKYNLSTQVVNNNSYDPLRPWGSNEIGRTWLDTRNLSYIPYYDPTVFTSRDERLSRWGSLADFATIDVYEWVQSSVPPSAFNALAAAQAGDADLDPNTKAAGEVALQETYSRDRQWSIRPIAWSYSPVPTDTDWGGMPPFGESNGLGYAGTQSVLIFDASSSGLVALSHDRQENTFAGIGVTAGMRIGAWDPTNTDPKPLSEYIVNSTFTKRIVSGSHSTSSGVPSTVVVTASSHTEVVGQLVFSGSVTTTRRSDANGLFIDEWDNLIQLKASTSGFSEVIDLGSYLGVNPTGDDLHDARLTITAGESASFVLPGFGLTIKVTFAVGSSGTYRADAIQQAIIAALGSNVISQDAVTVTEVVPHTFDDVPHPEQITNDTIDPAFAANHNHGWRAWSVPTQAQLDADGRQPISSWRPYVGSWFAQSQFNLPQIQDAVSYAKAPLTLNDDTVIERYATAWLDWGVLKNTVVHQTKQAPSGQMPIAIGTATIDAASTSVYVNGIAQLKAAYSIVGNTVTITSVQAGSTATVIVRKYAPTVKELAFDPDVADDLTFQKQYKLDYEYVSLEVRDSEGSFSTPLYYFWVKNKSTPAKSKKISISSIAQELRDGPPNYLTFQNLLVPTSSAPYRYDAITISGLSYIVAKDDTFKLRFTRNFTLRDDPQNLDLKDTHTEWSIIRPGQRTKIPESLWQKVVDSVAGEDTAGNSVPSLRRTLYDERTGGSTQYGFGAEQTLAPRTLLVSSITDTIVNTKLIDKTVPPDADGNYPADFMSFLNFDAQDTWFETPSASRATMTDIWTKGKPVQINEVFFAALNDILASNYELSDIFKTSRLSAYSIKVIAPGVTKATYE